MSQLNILVPIVGVNDTLPVGATTGHPSSGSAGAQFKSPTTMPNDQLAKLMEMHKKSAENAGIYVAVVLAVYVVLLSLLLCRYIRRRPTTRELPSLTPAPSASPLSILASCPLNCLNHSVALLSALRHCSFARGGGVSSLSSDSKEYPDDNRRLSLGHHNRPHTVTPNPPLISTSQEVQLENPSGRNTSDEIQTV